MHASVIDKQVVVPVYSKKYIFLASTLFSLLMLKQNLYSEVFAEIHVGIFLKFNHLVRLSLFRIT